MKTQNKKTTYQEAFNNLKLACYERNATAETFEETIKVCGLTMEIIILIASYYQEDLSNYDLIKF